MFTHTHTTDGREHVRCALCDDCQTFPLGDLRGVDDWKRRHRCKPYPTTDPRAVAA